MARQKKDLWFLLSLIEKREITSWSQLLEKETLIKAVRAFRGSGCASGSYDQERWKLHRRCVNPNSLENFYLTSSTYFDFFNVFVFDYFIQNRAWTQASKGCENATLIISST
jgi:hypothetical protein